MKRFFASLLSLAFCAMLLAGCGGAPRSAASSAAAVPAAAPAGGENASYDMEAGVAENGYSSGEKAALLPQDDRKIIYNATLQLESKEYDTTLATLLKAATDAKGYVQSSSEGGSAESGSRWANYTFRIPSAGYTGFLNSASGAGNLVQKSETTQDVTAEYVDIEARLESLRTQETRLLEMAAKAEKLEDLLTIEEHLSQIRYQIESYTGQQKVYDSLISYSTVEVSLQEVRLFTPTSPSFGSRVSAAFSGSWAGFVNGTQSFVIGFIYLLPTLLVLAVLVLAAVLIVRTVKKRRPVRPLPHPTAQEKQPPSYGPEA